MNAKVKQALALIDLGFRVHPLEPGGKTPLTNWRKSATTRTGDVYEWWTNSGTAIGNPENNIGIVTDGWCVVDFDVASDYNAWTQKIHEDGHDPTGAPLVRTPRGYHLYFRGEAKNAAGIGRNVDVRGEGGYVVAPGSVVNGHEYILIGGHLGNAPKTPSWLFDAIKRHMPPLKGANREDGEGEARGIGLSDSLQIPEGTRNQTLTSAAGAMRRAGMEVEEIRIALHTINRQRVVPPLPSQEVEAISDSIGRYRRGIREVPAVIEHGGTGSDLLRKHLGLIKKGVLKEYTLNDFKQLCQMTKFLRPRTATMLASDPGVGKSTLIIQWLAEMYAQGIPASAFMLEDPAEEHLKRALSQMAIEGSKITHIDWIEAHPEKFEASVKKYQQSLDAIGEMLTGEPRGSIHMEDVLKWMEEKAKAGDKVLIIDPIKAMAQERDQHLVDDQFVSAVKDLKARYNLAVIVANHPNKDFGQRRGGDPTLGDIAGGASLTRLFHNVFSWPRFPMVIGAKTKNYLSCTIGLTTLASRIHSRLSRTEPFTSSKRVLARVPAKSFTFG